MDQNGTKWINEYHDEGYIAYGKKSVNKVADFWDFLKIL